MIIDFGNKTLFFLSGSMLIIAGLASTYAWLLFWGVLFILISTAGVILDWWEIK